MPLFKKNPAPDTVKQSTATPAKPVKKGFSFLRGKKQPEPSVDFSASLARAINNPLRTATQQEKNHPSNLRETLSAIEASFYVIDQIREVLVEACQLVLRAKDVDDLAGRSLLAEQYDELRHSISQILAEADIEAARLLGASASALNANLGNQRVYSVDPARLDIDEEGLHLPPPSEAFAQTAEIANILQSLDQAVARIDRVSGFYMKDAQFLISRLDK